LIAADKGMNSATNTELYNRDFFEWVQHNVDLLQRGRPGEADLAHIADELEGLARYERRTVKKRLTKLAAQLLKWKYQPDKRYTRTGASFRLSKIIGRRWRLGRILKQSPSLRRYAACALAGSYSRAAERASVETGIPRDQFPPECPFTLDQLLDKEFLPE
jgi:hypothetical protein